MSLDIVIRQTAFEKKPLPLKVILGGDFLYGMYDEGWRLQTGVKSETEFIAYMPMQLARGISIKWSEEELDYITIRALTPTAPVELRALYEMVYRICTYWECELLIDDRPMELDEFIGDFEAIVAFNQKTLHDMAKSIIDGENNELTLFSVMWPLVMGKNEAEAFLAEPSYYSKWLHDKQNIDAYFAKPAFYRGEDKIFGRYALSENIRTILPIKPYVPYGFDDPETGELIDCSEFGMLLYDVHGKENIGEMDYLDFVKAVKKVWGSKVRPYDGNHMIIEGMSVEELKELLDVE